MQIDADADPYQAPSPIAACTSAAPIAARTASLLGGGRSDLVSVEQPTLLPPGDEWVAAVVRAARLSSADAHALPQTCPLRPAAAPRAGSRVRWGRSWIATLRASG